MTARKVISPTRKQAPLNPLALRKVPGGPELRHLPLPDASPPLLLSVLHLLLTVLGPAGSQPEAPWQNVDLSTWTFPESPFQRVYADLEHLQLQYNRLEHITRGVNDALHDCGPGNILRELAKRADRKELDQARKEHDRTKEELERVRSVNTHLNAQVSAMTQELNRKTEEIRKHHAEQTVVFQRIRELVGQPAEAVVKARLFDELLKKAEPYEARKTLPILVKYTRLMNGLFEDVQRLIPPSGTPRRVLYPGPTRISIRNTLRGGGRGGGGPQSAYGCGTRGGVQTRKHRKGAGEDPLLSAKEEDHRIREIRKGSVPSPPEPQPVPDTGSFPNSGSAT